MSSLSRRQVIKGAGVGAGVVAGAALARGAAAGPASAAVASATAAPSSAVFAHGVASGDPMPDGVVLWTRVTPTTASTPGSGLGPDVTVAYDVASDPSFRTRVASGKVPTGPGRDHTVKVTLRGLAAGATYWYRFRLGTATSPVGRTRTAPAPGAPVDRLRFGIASCANLQAGWFSPYRHLAARDDLDAVLHLGDYLYEYAPGEYQARDRVIRPHDPATEMTTLEHYRRRHAQYKRDPDLQALHAKVPFVVTWDDHESANDAWTGGAENHTEGAEGVWATRLAASQQAYAEWMPVRYEPGGRLYRRATYGTLASLTMLDLRSYRSQQASNQADSAIDDPARSITGPDQMAWLLDGLSTTDAQWKLVGNPVMISPVRIPSTLSTREASALHELTGTKPVDGVPYNVDQWDGYGADQRKVLGHLRDNAITDTVFVTGDIHSAWACDLPADPATYPANGRSVATELVGTSVTSDNVDDILGVPPRTASLSVESSLKAANPHIKHIDLDSHGYSVLDLTPERAQMDWYVVSDRTDPAATASRSASWQVLAGTQKVTPATGGAL